MLKTSGLVLVALFALSRPAQAQWGTGDTWTNSYGNSFNNPTSALMNQYMWDDVNKKSIYKPVLKKRGYTDEQLKNMSAYQMEQIILAKDGSASPSSDPPPSDGAQPVQPPYQPPYQQPAQPPPQQPRFIAGATAFRPVQGRLIVTPLLDQLITEPTLRRTMGQGVYAAFQGWEALAVKAGLSNDVAGATAFLVAACYSIYTNKQVPDAGLVAAANALRANLSNEQMAKVSSADKQKFYELMITMGTVLVIANQQAYNQRDVTTQTAIRKQAGDVLRDYLKLDPDSFTLTEQGFAPVQRSQQPQQQQPQQPYAY